ncbi:MAG: YbaK/EbsC family protein [Clostridia bacterium]|nr:YbaK/EbsC family protein [Clostridia bacterium]
MSIELVRPFLAQFGREQDILEFPVSSATVELAAAALSVEPGRIAKTMSFADGEGCLVVVTAGDTKIDNSKYKHTFGFKAKMLSPDQALAFTGHAVGGVCPFALPETVRIFLDESIRRFETVYPAAGSSNSAVEVTADQLEQYTGGIWVDVCKLKVEQ